MKQLGFPGSTLLAALGSSILAALIHVVFPGKTFGAWWFPGLAFGALFALANRRKTEFIISFSVLAGVSYCLAVEAELRGEFRYNLPVPPGLVGGLVGTSLLITSLMLLVSLRINFRLCILTLVVGSLLGLLFMAVRSLFMAVDWLGKPARFVEYFLEYTVWQLPVAVLLSKALLVSPEDMAELPTEAPAWARRASLVLQGPLVSLIGLISSILGIISFFSGR